MKNKNERLAYRLGGILERLNAGERISVNELAETYGVTPRTIQRDIAERLAFLEDKFLEKGPGYYRLDKAKLGHLCQADIERFSRFSSVQERHAAAVGTDDGRRAAGIPPGGASRGQPGQKAGGAGAPRHHPGLAAAGRGRTGAWRTGGSAACLRRAVPAALRLLPQPQRPRVSALTSAGGDQGRMKRQTQAKLRTKKTSPRGNGEGLGGG